MSSNILIAIKNLVESPVIELTSHYSGRNRANGVGDALEKYIKDLFANTLSCNDDYCRIQTYNEVFSYTGNQNNPPDIILKNGDAIEVKKVQSNSIDLQLNSSYPKAKLYSNSRIINRACQNCEQWTEKDIIYIIGHTDDNSLKELWFVYGDCYAADKGIYERIKNTITEGLHSIPNIELAETNELGRINKVDPLGITSLRVRGMWLLSQPKKAFDYLPKKKENSNFAFYCVIKEEKYNSFSEIDRNNLENLVDNNKFFISSLQIKNPNNPANLENIKFLEFYYD